MERIGALGHLQTARRDYLTFNRARQVQGHQALRRELAVLSPRHLLTYRESCFYLHCFDVPRRVIDTCSLWTQHLV